MLSVDQVQRIILESGFSNKEISQKMRKSEKYLSAQLNLYKEKNLPFSTHLCKLLFKVIKPKIYRRIISEDLIDLCCSDHFLSAEQFYLFIEKSHFRQMDIAQLMGIDSKTIYMAIRSRGGVKFSYVKNIYEICPVELSKVLTKTQLEVILNHL